VTTRARRIEEASRMLWQHWQQRERMRNLPDALRPQTRADGYAVQARLAQRSASPLFGWKIAATSQAGQAHIAVDGPMAGRLLRERVRESGGHVPLVGNHMRVAEAEFAFRLGVDLPPRRAPYRVAEVVSAVATLHPAIEVPDSRYEDFTIVGAPQLIADNACADYFVLGPAAPSGWRSIDLAAHGVMGRVNDEPPREGIGANVLGDPREALTWLVNELVRLNVAVAAGEVVTTGTCLAPLAVEPGDHVVADFGAIGSVDVWVDA
jgi:2-keto-4-pentenoate hydratase